jgi:hypothetical protein
LPVNFRAAGGLQEFLIVAAIGTTTSSATRTTLGLFGLSLILLLLSTSTAHALIDIFHTDNNIPIGSYPGWTEGDPGWDNVGSGGKNYTYIGDSWVITARHTGAATAQFLGQNYELIPSQNYTVHNPSGWAIPLSSETDLMLLRIKGEPALPNLTIASEPPPLGAEVVFIGRGSGRSNSEYHWSVNKSDPDNWVWTQVSSGGDYSGYKAANPKVKRWGTNTIADDQLFYDPDATPQLNGDNDPDNNHVITVGNRNVVTLTTTLDQTGGTSHEVQAIPGNSGSAVFYKRDGQWELSGIVNAAFAYDNQYDVEFGCACNSAVYGNGIAFTDLSVYHDKIYEIINAHPNYSVMGDLNLDGVVSGDGTGTSATDDVTAFIEGWLYQQPVHSITSWQKGDLNLDGKTSLADFLLMRDALSHSGSGAGAAALASFLGGQIQAIPEPSSACLLLLTLPWLLRAARHRLRRIAA